MNIIENDMESITFNFFESKCCSNFIFCHSYKTKLEYISKLLEMTPEERLKSLQPFLNRNNKGKSCEFYFQGRFYQCGNVSDILDAKAQNMKNARKTKLTK